MNSRQLSAISRQPSAKAERVYVSPGDVQNLN
jgi:hypothetical protein